MLGKNKFGRYRPILGQYGRKIGVKKGLKSTHFEIDFPVIKKVHESKELIKQCIPIKNHLFLAQHLS